MGIDSNNWGGIVISPSPKKKSITLELNKDMSIRTMREYSNETKEERMKRLQQERKRKLGVI